MSDDPPATPPGDAASCSALGACLVWGARRLDTTDPDVALALARLGGEVQRYAVSLRSALILERYDGHDSSARVGAAARVRTFAAVDSGPDPEVHRAVARQLASARRGRAEAALQRAARDACRDFGDLPKRAHARM